MSNSDFLFKSKNSNIKQMATITSEGSEQFAKRRSVGQPKIIIDRIENKLQQHFDNLQGILFY